MTVSQPLMPGLFYHLFSRGINRDPIFRTDQDYRSFLEKFEYHVSPVLDTFAYCLMGNHFHFLVQVREDILQQGIGIPVTAEMTSQAISNCLNAHAKTFNLRHQRTGSLFERPFKRVPIKDEGHLLTVIPYIHQNPAKHGFVADFRDWPWSSYWDLLAKTPTLLNRPDCLAWFGGRQPFIASHHYVNGAADTAEWAIDDWE
ncbi:MAG: transposase [Anaerolineales bacterium]|nr:transposase [Anaerolineales bacterium]